MVTTARNNIVRTVNPGSVFEDMTQFVNATITFQQGDLLWLDTVNHLIKPMGAVAANSNSFLGVAVVTVSAGKILSPYQGTAVDASGGTIALPGPKYGVIASLFLNTGDSISPGQLVYPTFTNDQTVTVSTASGSAVGTYQGKALTSVASGTLIEVYVGHQYPGNTLVM